MGIESFDSTKVLRANPRLPENKQEQVETILEKSARLRKDILESFPTQETGINSERVLGFFREQGLRVVPFVFLNKTHSLEKLKGKYKKAGIVHSLPPMKSDPWVAVYDTEIDLILINIDDNFNTRDSLSKEWVLVHEEAHASCQYGECILLGKRAFRPRTGFSVEVRKGKKEINFGEFLEEGFAEYMASEYRNRYADEEILERFKKTTGEDEIADLDQMVDIKKHNFPIPMKYLDVDKDGDIYINISLFAGYAFELMIRKNPHLLDIAIKARSDPKMLSRMVMEINALSPGLYSKLRKLKYNSKDFKKGVEVVLDALTAKDPQR